MQVALADDLLVEVEVLDEHLCLPRIFMRLQDLHAPAPEPLLLLMLFDLSCMKLPAIFIPPNSFLHFFHKGYLFLGDFWRGITLLFSHGGECEIQWVMVLWVHKLRHVLQEHQQESWTLDFLLLLLTLEPTSWPDTCWSKSCLCAMGFKLHAHLAIQTEHKNKNSTGAHCTHTFL